MGNWKPWQFVFLGYLLVLNVAVFCTLAFFLFNRTFPLSPQPPSNLAAASKVAVTATALPLDAVVPTHQIQPTPTPPQPEHIPPVNIPPVLPPDQPETIANYPGSQDNAATPTLVAVAQLPSPTVATPTSTPSPPPTSTSTSTLTPTPTHLPSPTPTHTPSSTPTSTLTPTPLPTRTATNTPTPTSTPTTLPTRTPTNTPQPTLTATRTPSHTPSATPTHTQTPAPTATPTPSFTPTRQPTAAPAAAEEAVAAVASTLFSGNGPDNESPPLERSGQVAANPHNLVDAVPLTNKSIALSWNSSGQTQQYKIYSDMGSGYGVYVYKAKTTQPTFIDRFLRPGITYNYRLTQTDTGQEVVVAQVLADTFATRISPDHATLSQVEVSAASVIAIPTALPADALLLGLVSDNSYTDEFNTLVIAGEVRNDSNLNAGQTDITVTFYDAAGAVIGAANGETLLKTIPPGEKSPFLISLTRPSGFASYSIRAVARPVAAKQTAQLAVVNVRRYEDDTGFFHITGIIENVGSTISNRTKVVAVIYGRDNGVINVGFTYVNPPTLLPGEQAAFEVIFAYYPRYLTQQVIPFEE